MVRRHWGLDVIPFSLPFPIFAEMPVNIESGSREFSGWWPHPISLQAKTPDAERPGKLPRVTPLEGGKASRLNQLFWATDTCPFRRDSPPGECKAWWPMALILAFVLFLSP